MPRPPPNPRCGEKNINCSEFPELAYVKRPNFSRQAVERSTLNQWLPLLQNVLKEFPKESLDVKEMATQIYIEKENDEIGTVAASKGRMQLISAPSKSFAERSCPKTPLVGRTANVNPAASQSVRKALGNLNRPLTTIKSNFPKGKKSSTKKATETANRVERSSMVTEDCPEKENLFSYDPLDFESFEVPEEHRLSHMPLTGVSLMVFENASDRFASTISVPAEEPSISWDYDSLQSTQDFLATLDEIIIDLPPPL